jgi:hypothetical protein
MDSAIERPQGDHAADQPAKNATSETQTIGLRIWVVASSSMAPNEHAAMA